MTTRRADFGIYTFDLMSTVRLPKFNGPPMSAPGAFSGDTEISVQQTTLYQWFREERDEILRHKWYESQKHGRDIGFEAALTDWILNHRAGWRQARMADQIGAASKPF